MAENFRTQILNSKETTVINTPVRTLGGCTYLYLRHNDIYILGVTKNNVNVMLAFKFMTSVSGPAAAAEQLQGHLGALSNGFVSAAVS